MRHHALPPLHPFLLRRAYSTAPPLITKTTIPAAHTGHITLLTLARPVAKNAISTALLKELREHVTPLLNPTSTSTRALILASNVPGIFCAGADLKERATFTPEQTATFLANLRGALRDISALPIPTISAISGLALGGGLELALATDLRVLGSRAQVGLPETRLGIIPGAGGTYRLPRLIGVSRAKDLIFTGRRVSAEEALVLGLANRVVKVAEERGEGMDEVVTAAVELAGEICGGGPVALRMGKRAVEGGCEETENKAYEGVVATEDRDEALKAFREKRKPVFKGSGAMDGAVGMSTVGFLE
ncbi:ClpP/crotonase [Choiromyces venosus 120613-1]|uniref:ClpP/crotonase n=1 Tax=Choiromyces venosus 120613-1 TaxID=1336337 RepID=A0A3N4JPH9_9PEZI|nr:ClpP/crotonase [Choiromyces venosus 120613-1]